MRSPRLQALTVIATAAGLPLVDAGIRAWTREPSLEKTELGGVAATVCRPAGAGPWPAAVVLNGATPLGNRHRAIQRLADGLARAGYLAVLPELPGLEEGEIDARTAEATVQVGLAVAARPDVRGSGVALLGVSTGAGLALLAAADDRLRAQASAVAAVAPFADLRLVLKLAATGVYEGDDGPCRYQTVPLLGRVVARSLAAALPDPDRTLLLDWLPASGEERDPLAPVPPELYARLGADGRAVAQLLANRDPARFDDLFESLPTSVHELVALLSPGRRTLHIEAPVELVTAPDDGYFPLGEAQRLAGMLPTSRLTVTSALEHVRLRTTPGGLHDLVGLAGATIRSLRAASSMAAPASRLRRGAGQPLRFLLVGAAGYGLNLLAFAALYAADVTYAVSAIAAYFLSNAAMYLGNRYFTFRLGHDGLLRGYARYVVVGLLVVAVNVVLLSSLVEGAGVDPRLAQALALVAITPLAFLVNKRWTFQLARA